MSRSSTLLKKRGSPTGDILQPAVNLDPYQVTTVKWLLGRPFAGVFLDPGLGKTLIVLMAFWLLRRAGHVKWLLVVAPLRPCYLVWPEEVVKWKFPFVVRVLHGPEKDAAVREPADVYVINYEGLGWLHDKIGLLRKRGTGWLIIDESTKVKHTSSLRHRLIKTMLGCFGRRTLLTGTPLPNGYVDLFGQVYCLDLGRRLGVYVTHFRQMYFTALHADGRAVDAGAPDEETRKQLLRQARQEHSIARWAPKPAGRRFIDDQLKDICIRFSDRELGLKAPRYDTIKVRLPPKARALYEQLERDFVVAFDDAGHVLAPNAGALGIKLRQVANGGVLDDAHHVRELHLAKAGALVDLVEELQGEPLLAGYEFTADAERFVKALRQADRDATVIRGGMGMDLQLRTLHGFNDGKIPVLLCQYQTVAHGLNLQAACRHVCFTGMLWDLELYIQFMKRVHRKGQRRQVIVHQLVADDTRDEVVAAAVQGKDRTQQRFLKMLEEYRTHG